MNILPSLSLLSSCYRSAPPPVFEPDPSLEALITGEILGVDQFALVNHCGSRPSVALLSERPIPLLYLHNIPYLRACKLDNQWFFEERSRHVERIHMGPLLPVTTETRTRIIEGAYIANGLMPKTFDDAARDYWGSKFLIYLLSHYLQPGTGNLLQSEHGISSACIDRHVRSALECFTSDDPHDERGLALAFSIYKLAGADIGSQNICRVADFIAGHSSASALNVVLWNATWLECSWLPAFALSIMGGIEAMQVLFDALSRACSGKGYWVTAQQEILAEALALATARNDAEVEKKMHLLEHSLDLPVGDHTRSLIKRFLDENPVASQKTGTKHRLEDHVIFLHYFAARSKDHDYDRAIKHDLAIHISDDS